MRPNDCRNVLHSLGLKTKLVPGHGYLVEMINRPGVMEPAPDHDALTRITLKTVKAAGEIIEQWRSEQ